ncbi:MAG: FMN-binding protein [Bacteroidetes bacterium]|nr:MAG: FMN-binding protein [Bacteroidota bacterium]
MKFKNYILVSVALLFLSFGLPKNIQKKVDKTIKSAFKIDTFTLNTIRIPSEIITTLPSTFNNNGLYKIISEDTFLGYAYIAKAPSRDDNFDYLVLFDKNLIIVKAKVLIYREDYGGEIGSRRWLKQFIGKTKDDVLNYGDNIAAISGATISVRSMTIGINTLLRSIKILHKKNIL